MTSPALNYQSTRIAFIGLGTMGYPMAGHLAKAGFDICVYNRTRSKSEAWCKEHPGHIANSIAEAAKFANIMLICVGGDEDVWEVSCGSKDSLIQGAQPNSIVVDHSSICAGMTHKVAEQLQSQKIAFMDAPVSGGQSGAEQAQLSIMCGGDPKIFDQLDKLFKHYAKAVQLIGPVGSGQLCKMVNQICVAGVLQGLSEGMHFAEQAELDLGKVFSAISEGAAGSWQMKHRHQTMIEKNYDFGFAVDWMRKDLRNCLKTAEETHSNLPITALIDQFYSRVQSLNGGRWDTSSLIEALREPPQ